MIHRFLAIALLAIGATVSHAQPSLPSSFQAKTIHSPEAADIFVRWGGKALSLCSFTDMRRTATPGLLWPQIS